MISRRLIAFGFATAVLAAPLWAAAATTTGSGNVTTENRTVSGFKSIATRGSIDLVVRQGSREGVQVQADDNLLPLIETVVEGDTLKIGVRRGASIHSKHDLVVTVDVVSLASLASSGSGDIHVNALQTPALSVALSGSGDLELDQITTDELSVRISGSSDVEAKGRAGRFMLSIAGSGDVKASGLSADDVSVRIAGSGDARVNAGKTLDVSIAGSGDVEYSGNATVKSSVAGSGSINRR